VLWDILQKAVHRGGVPAHIIVPNLMNFFEIGGGAPALPVAGPPNNFDEMLMENVFINGQGKVYKKNLNSLPVGK
jgi:hypothetical protein